MIRAIHHEDNYICLIFNQSYLLFMIIWKIMSGILEAGWKYFGIFFVIISLSMIIRDRL